MAESEGEIMADNLKHCSVCDKNFIELNIGERCPRCWPSLKKDPISTLTAELKEAREDAQRLAEALEHNKFWAKEAEDPQAKLDYKEATAALADLKKRAG